MGLGWRVVRTFYTTNGTRDTVYHTYLFGYMFNFTSGNCIIFLFVQKWSVTRKLIVTPHHPPSAPIHNNPDHQTLNSRNHTPVHNPTILRTTSNLFPVSTRPFPNVVHLLGISTTWILYQINFHYCCELLYVDIISNQSSLLL